TGTLTLNMDGAKGEYMQASGYLTLDLYGFVQVTGNLAVSKSSDTLTLAKKSSSLPAETVRVDVLTLGGSDIDVFAGVSGGTADAMGLSLTDIDFGLALISSQTQPSRKWTALTASAASVSVVGMSDLAPTVNNLTVELNQAGMALDQVVDFKVKNLDVVTSGTSKVTLKFDGTVGEMLRAEGDVTLRISDFAYFSGRIGFEKYSPTGVIRLNNNDPYNTQTPVPSTASTSMMAITGTGITAFVGYAQGGIDSSKTLVEQQSNLYGFGVDSLDFGVLMSRVGGQSYTAFKASMDDARLYGFDPSDFELSAQHLRFEYNSADRLGRTINYADSFSGGVVLGSTGAVTIDFSGAKRLGVYAQTATLSISQFMYLSGSIGFEQATYTDLKSGAAGTTVVPRAQGFSVGGSNITAFMGYADGGIDRSKTLQAQASSLYGFGAEGISFGLLSVKDMTGIKYTALKAQVAHVQVYGFDPDDFQLSASGVTLEYNHASMVGRELNFAAPARELAIPTGDVAHPVTLDFSGNRLGVFASQVTLQLSQFMFVQGAIAFLKSDFTTLKAGGLPVATTLTPAKGFSMGGADIDVFVGYASEGFDSSKSFASQASALYGFGAENIDFGVLQVKSAAGVSYTAAKAHADTVALYGFDPNDFQLSLSGIDFKLNTATGTAPALNFLTSFPKDASDPLDVAGYELPTGGTPVLLDMTGATVGASMNNATLRISDFVHVSGSFAFEKTATQVLSAKTLLTGTQVPVMVNAITLGASHVQAFLGVGGPYRTDTNGDGAITVADTANPDAIGMVIDDFTFGLGLFQDKLTGAKYTALKATANDIGFTGLGDAFAFDLQDVVVAINTSSNPLLVLDLTKTYDGLLLRDSPGYRIPTGGTDSVLLDFSNQLIQATVGHATAKVAGFVSLEGGFTFQKRVIDKVGFHGLGMDLEMAADALIVAGQHVQAFAGFNGPYKTDSNNDGNYETNDDAIGIAVADLDFALVLVGPSLGGARLPLNFFGLTAKAGLAGLVGTDPYLTLDTQDVVFEFNGALAGTIPLPSVYADFSVVNGGRGLDIPIGSNPAALNVRFDSNFLRVGMQANLGVFDLFTLNLPRFDFTFELPPIDFGVSIDLSNIGLPGFEMPAMPAFDPNMFLPSISLQGLLGAVPDLLPSTPDWLVDGLKYLKDIDIRIGLAGVMGSI
ncbi:MAG: hypothetical protein WCK08_17350, partial [Betaproteobacteria bacterium]